MTELFGTDGIRGTANEPPLTPRCLVDIGTALNRFWKQSRNSPTIAVGHDGRLSADMIRNALTAGLTAGGANVADIGFCSTPAVAYLCREQECDGAVMLSASHNPYPDNGLKPLQASGEKFTDAQEQQVEEFFEQSEPDLVPGEDLGRVYPRESWLSEYVQALSTDRFQFPGHVLVDCAHGGTSRLAAAVLGPVCDRLTVLNNEPNGTNINQECGSLHVDQLVESLQEHGADVGFAFDGDGDRVLAVDETGTVQDGDVLMYLIAAHQKEYGKLDGNGIVLTSMSNLGLRRALDRIDVSFEVVGVGDRQVYQRLVEKDWRLGGEQSGHLIDRHWLPTGDGLRTALTALRVFVESAKPLSHWGEEVPEYPQVLHNVDVDRKPPLSSLEETSRHIQSVEESLGEEGRVVVRYSGTEPVARIMLEGPDQEELETLSRELGDTLSREIHDEVSGHD